jgi:hypothetical protein
MSETPTKVLNVVRRMDFPLQSSSRIAPTSYQAIEASEVQISSARPLLHKSLEPYSSPISSSSLVTPISTFTKTFFRMQLSPTLATLLDAVALAAPASEVPTTQTISTYAHFCTEVDSTGVCAVLSSSPQACAPMPTDMKEMASVTPLESFCYFYTFVFPSLLTHFLGCVCDDTDVDTQ